ncbi:hypothetical protein PA598K_05237 [Paenibacillus sp. 598K]|nr:hypothetical protein PA598K_05237 [Paenibacillus sp. 598K]
MATLLLLLAVLAWQADGVDDKPRSQVLQGVQEELRAHALITHDEAIRLIASQYKAETGVPLATDLEDKSYRGYVKSMGTAFGAFSDEEMAQVVEYVKFMDKYENVGRDPRDRIQPGAPSTLES